MLTVIECKDSNARKTIHQYLNNSLKIKTTSLFCKLFESANDSLFVKAYYMCDVTGKTYLYNYHDFINHPEKYKYYDDIINDASLVAKNNIIVCGEYLKGYNKNKNFYDRIVPEEEYNEVMLGLNIFTIPEPDKLINKKELEHYILLELDRKYGSKSENPQIIQPRYDPKLGTPNKISIGIFNSHNVYFLNR